MCLPDKVVSNNIYLVLEDTCPLLARWPSEEFQINSVILYEIKLLHQFNFKLINCVSENNVELVRIILRLVHLTYSLPHGQVF